jgi:hypothetical protein
MSETDGRGQRSECWSPLINREANTGGTSPLTGRPVMNDDYTTNGGATKSFGRPSIPIPL